MSPPTIALMARAAPPPTLVRFISIPCFLNRPRSSATQIAPLTELVELSPTVTGSKANASRQIAMTDRAIEMKPAASFLNAMHPPRSTVRSLARLRRIVADAREGEKQPRYGNARDFNLRLFRIPTLRIHEVKARV